MLFHSSAENFSEDTRRQAAARRDGMLFTPVSRRFVTSSRMLEIEFQPVYKILRAAARRARFHAQSK